MSTRKSNMVTGKLLIRDTIEKKKKKIKDRDWDEENKPTHFTVIMSYENDKEICNIWDATLIYQL